MTQQVLVEEEKYTPELREIPLDKVRVTGPETGSVPDNIDLDATAITVREKTEPAWGKVYEIGNGNQRFMAACDQDRSHIYAFVYPEDTPDHLFYGNSLSQNFRRKHNPLHEGKMLKSLVEEKNMMPRTLANRLGTSVSVIEKLIAIANLPELIKAGIHSGNIAASTAKQLATMRPDMVGEAVSIYRSQGKLTLSDVKGLKKQATRDRIEEQGAFDIVDEVMDQSPKQKLQATIRSLGITKDQAIQWLQEM